jgi:hypothetical protein
VPIIIKTNLLNNSGPRPMSSTMARDSWCSLPEQSRVCPS